MTGTISNKRSDWHSFRAAAAFLRSRLDRAVKARLALVLLLVIFSSALTALMPMAIKWIVDAQTDATDGGIATMALVLIGAYVIGHWLMRVGTLLRETIFSRTAWRIWT